ncbi:hypothetical protein [Flavihumibacter fluvii]|uniref:hypothetical protein n=1 Tax=Flavihumibacter fluvii TaxID=2838157 RepID=UPI001BDEE371|nr:hypothetical protein [Flavihumibacter fluvii]ULQ54808.1 hypothetical protein KJS93_10830 [Flavihumibacter fluvii]
MKSNTNPKVPYRMERVKALINKLQEQLNQQADAPSLLLTVQLLEAELSSQFQPFSNRSASTKVAVVMPHSNRQTASSLPAEPLPVKADLSVPEEKAPLEPVQQQEPVQQAEPEIARPQTDWLHNLMQQIPTLAHQKDIREINEVINTQVGASLNEKLKQSAIELGDTLTREPVRDLKKAIGVNDRFVFVNELFRGDEVMYERSIKTINSFNILQEAEFWMERELKLKLAWDESKDVVRHFCQIVRRRFA